MRSRWGALAAAALVTTLAGCGSDTDDERPPAASTSATPSATASASASAAQSAPAGPVVDVTIKDGTVTPRGKRVEVGVGEPVTLRVTSDAADELHVHADPEQTLEVEPGRQELELTVDVPGQVAVESHHLDATIVQLVVRP